MDMATGQSLFVLAVLCTIVLLWRGAWYLLGLASRFLRVLPRRVAGSRVWAGAHPLRAAMARRFPKTYRFTAQRLDPGRFVGLPLTLLVAGALYVLMLLGGIVEELVEAEEINRFDLAVNAFFVPYRHSPLVEIFVWITGLGASNTLVGVAIVATGFLWADRRAGFIAPLWVCILGSQATTWLGKFGFDRDRPEFTTAVTALSPSFPSGHASGAMAVYGFLAYAIARDLDGARQRFEVAYWTLVLILLVGLSRLFLGVHFASDVAAGLLVGGFWLLAGFAVSEHLRQ